MAGIYIHIPFCKKACSYCDFYFITSLKYESDYIKSLTKEIDLRKSEFNDIKIDTIYFGGGTPSILNENSLYNILNSLSKNFALNNNLEITIECNPDDISILKLKSYKSLNINRLSIGVQSFDDEDLKFMKRVHNGVQAKKSIKLSQDQGFTNISIDLIYGLPTSNSKIWKKNLEIFKKFNLVHLSSYSLTVEKNTLLFNLVKKKNMEKKIEDNVINQFRILLKEMKKYDYENYEISSFCIDKMYSKHNCSYWNGEKYFGIGVAAHSFDGIKRKWNKSNIKNYIINLSNNKLIYDFEILDNIDLYNEYILTSLRTSWGCSITKLVKLFPKQYIKHFYHQIEKYQKANYVIKKNINYCFTDQGKLFSNKVISDLFISKDENLNIVG